VSISLSLKNLFVGSSVARMSNEALILLYATKKESHVLAQLYDNCERDLFHFLLSLTDSELAQEVAQLTWLKVIEKAHLYRDQGSFKSWLFTISRRCLIDEFRKAGRFQELFEEPTEAITTERVTSENSDSFTSANEDTATLTDVELLSHRDSNSSIVKQFNIALSSLPFSQKEAFCLQQEGFSLAEISQLTASETETVKSRIRYAKQALKKHLEKYRD
jgi:RNA polymerase sigma factor (sigma-70 family)